MLPDHWVVAALRPAVTRLDQEAPGAPMAQVPSLNLKQVFMS